MFRLTREWLSQARQALRQGDRRASAHRVRSISGRNHSVEVQDLRLDHPELTEGGSAHARKFSQAPIIGVANNTKQLFNASAPDRRNDAKLNKMSADRINHRGLLGA